MVRFFARKTGAGCCVGLLRRVLGRNPIGAGDIDGNHGETLYLKQTDTSVHIVTRPLQYGVQKGDAVVLVT